MMFGKSKKIDSLTADLAYEVEQRRALQEKLWKLEFKFDMLAKYLNVAYQENQTKEFVAITPTSPPTSPTPASL